MDKNFLKEVIVHETGLQDHEAEFFALCIMAMSKVPDLPVRDMLLHIHSHAMEEIRDFLRSGELPDWLVAEMGPLPAIAEA